MFGGIVIKCDICGCTLMSYGCCVYAEDLIEAEKSHLCKLCKKAVKDAKEQREYLNNLKCNIEK